MKAAVLRGGAMVVDEVADPVPAEGQVLVRTIACGICGSDLHFAKHGRRMVEVMGEAAGGEVSPLAGSLDFDRDIVMGHEFSAEVIDHGPNTQGAAIGTTVVSLPILMEGWTMADMRAIGYSNTYPGGYGEFMVLSAPLLLEVPNGLDPRHAALTEPMAVGLHAVNRSRIQPGESALVLGCGPVGLAVIAALRLKGIDVIVASDFSPARRALAATMGATQVVDPAVTPAIIAWREAAGTTTPVLYEAVGVQGMLGGAMRDAPRGARILVVGVCMEDDTIIPMHGINKELEIQFVLGYGPDEFGDTLRSIAEGEVDVAPLITGSVDIDGVAGAFDALANPDAHAKILVEPT